MRIVLVFLTLFVTACQTNPLGGDVPDRLALQVRTFEDVVRWGNLENMYLFQRIEPGREPQVEEGLGNIRVTGYETSQLSKLGELRWGQTAVIDYVLTDRQVVRQLVDHQVWESADEGKTWQRTTPVPRFN